MLHSPMGLTMMSESLHVQAGRGAMPIENGQGQDAGGGEPRALTVSNVIKEIQVLKDKFKNDDEDHCKSAHATHVLVSDLVGRGVLMLHFSRPNCILLQSPPTRIWKRPPCYKNAGCFTTRIS